MSSDVTQSANTTTTNDLTYNLQAKVPVPRDPAAYRATDHFQYRFNQRSDPEITGDVIETCILEGRIKNTDKTDRFIFEAQVGDWEWWVIAAVRDEAFLDPGRKHRILTAVVPEEGVHEDADEEWSP